VRQFRPRFQGEGVKESYSPYIETIQISCTIFEIWHVFVYKSSAVAEMGDRSVATIDMGRKEGGLLSPYRGRKLGPRLTPCGLGRGLLPYQVASSFIQPFDHNRHGPKTG